MLPLEKTLGEVILDLIKNDPRSISGITRELRTAGHKYHKLVVTGYLQAMEDFGYVRERDLPPSKVYYKAIPHKKDIYESIGENISDPDLTTREQILVAIYVLGRLFHRPIFRKELAKCGFTGDINAPPVDRERSADARKILLKSGFKIPKNEPAYEVKLDLEDKFQEILLVILIEQFGIKKLIYEGTQSKLDSGMLDMR